MTGRHHTTVDRGSVLPIVLVVMVALGIVVVAVAKYATSSLRYSRVTEANTDRLYAAESELRVAIDQLRDGVAMMCLLDTGESTHTIGLQGGLNQSQGSIACTNESGPLVTNATNWALVITGEGMSPSESLIPTWGGSSNKVIDGHVWMSRIDSSALADIDSQHKVEIHSGSLAYAADGPAVCPDQTPVPSKLVFTSPLAGPACVEVPWTNQAGFDDPPLPDTLLTLPVNPPPRTPHGPNCLVYDPGVYTDMPSIVGKDAYFSTGDYYFAPSSGTPIGNALFEIRDSDVRAGSLNSTLGITPEVNMGSSPCAPAIVADAAGVSGTFGATFYFGSNAHLYVNDLATLEIMPRQHSGFVGIQAICDPAEWPGSSWCDSSNASGVSLPMCDPGDWSLAATCTIAGTPDVRGLVKSTLPGFVGPNPGSDRSLIRTQEHSNAELIVHGLVHVPLHQVRLQEANSAETQVKFLGGLMTSRLDLGIDPTNLAIEARSPALGSGSIPAASTDIRLTATATTDGSALTMESIVHYTPSEPDPLDRLVVKSWRVCDTTAC